MDECMFFLNPVFSPNNNIFSQLFSFCGHFFIKKTRERNIAEREVGSHTIVINYIIWNTSFLLLLCNSLFTFSDMY